MSLLPNTSHANPTTPFYSPRTSGKFPVVAGFTQTIPIAGMTPNGNVMLMYIHNGNAGQGQFFSNVVCGTNQVVITLGQTGSTSPQEYIVWHVLSF